MEQERIQFLKLNLSNYANLIIGCLENEIQAYERVNGSIKDIDADIDLAEFVNENRSTHIVPSPMDYIKLHAYSETDQGKGVGKHTFHAAIDHEEHSDAEDHEQIKKSMSISLDNGLEKEEALEADLHEKPELEPSNPRASMTSAIEEQSEAEALSIMMIGKMEVYGSDEDDEEYVYVTDTESEGEEEEQADIYAGNKKEETYDYDLPSEQYNSTTN
ncbi:hypothetical protein G6F36_014537 [Rhizopus arrhizus]|nr:hypothetical protein G6F36_014537 [Rhizopus arrhizus]